MKKIIEKKRKSNRKGFTLIEILVVIGIIAILATIVLVAVNPNRQFKLARDSQRTANVASILNAIGQNIADNAGIFSCNGSAFSLPTSTQSVIANTGGVNLAPCIVPTYISALPFDPTALNGHYTDTTNYNTGYKLLVDSNGRVTISAQSELSTSTISVTR